MNPFVKNISFLVLATTMSCSRHQPETPAHEEESSTLVSLTDTQFQALQIKTGSLTPRSLSGNIKASGMLDVPPQNLASVSVPLGGFIKFTEMLQGMSVKMGDVLAVMENPDYIQLQQDYWENKNQLGFLEQEYNRQVDLSKENVNALKSLQQAKSNYFGMKVKVEGLKAKLKLININPADNEMGEIKSTINVLSPISGFVSQVNVNMGMHVNPSDVMFRIVDTHHLHAEVQVFENDILKLKVGQLARITLSNDSKERLAKVYLIGKEISPERTVRVHCHLEDEDTNLTPGTYFSAVIETGLNSVLSLPENAIINFDGKKFVFVKQDAPHQYELVEVNTGTTDQNYVEVSFKNSSDEKFKNKIVVEGSFELLNVLKNRD